MGEPSSQATVEDEVDLVTVDDDDLSESYVEDDAEASRRVLPERAATRYRVAIVGLLGLAGALTLGAAVRLWLPPWVPLAVFCLLGVAPLLFWAALGAFLFDPSKATDGVVRGDSPPLLRRLRLALTPVLLAGLAGAPVMALWYVPQVRAAVAHVSTSQRLSGALEGALVDDHPTVRLAACEGLAALKDDNSSNLLTRLSDESDEVVECALTTIPSFPNAPRELSVAAATWHGELTHPEAVESLTGDRACVLSNRLRVAERKGVAQSPMYLLGCALEAPSGAAQECCAQSFRAMLGGSDVEPVMVMRSPGEMLHGGFLRSLPALLLATHSDQPDWEQKRTALRLGTPSSRAWSMAIGCEALNIAGAGQRHAISAAMADAVSSDSCQIGPATETTVRLWEAVCSRLYSFDQVTQADGTEDDRFCSAINGTLVMDATNDARRTTQAALRSAREPDRRRAMMSALLSYSGRMANAMMEQDSGQKPAGKGSGAAFDLPTLGGGGAAMKPGEATDMFSRMVEMFAGGHPGQQEDERPEDYFERYIFDQAEKDLKERGIDADPRNFFD